MAPVRKGKGKNQASQEPVPPQEAPQEVAQQDPVTTTEVQEEPQSPPKTDTSAPETTMKEEPRSTLEPEPVEEKPTCPKKKGSVDSLLIELLEASHEALDGYTQLNKGKIRIIKTKWSTHPKCTSRMCQGSSQTSRSSRLLLTKTRLGFVRTWNVLVM